MRFVHTSDWHLGRSFGTYGLLADQERFVDWFVEFVADARAELVVIAGDVYDRSNPSAEAISLFNRAVAGLHRAGVEVLVIAGNHDNPERVALYSAITEHHGVILRGGYTRVGAIVVRAYADGPLAIAPIPFLDPRLVPPASPLFPADEGPYTHHAVTARAADAARAAVPSGMRSLAVAHGFVAGGRGSDSEKVLVGSVGGAEHIGSGCFTSFSYTALGHLHTPQSVGGSDTIRYSGSPLPYSFSEVGAKRVLVVDMDSTGTCAVDAVEIPVGRRVRTIRSRFDTLMGGPGDHQHLIRIELSDPTLIRDAKRRLEEKFPFLIELAIAPSSPAPAATGPRSTTSAGSVAEHVAQFLSMASGDDPSTEDFEAILDVLAAEGMQLGDVERARLSLLGPATEDSAA